MKIVNAINNCLLLNNDGSINYPFSKYLTNEFTNPNTRELVSQSLRIFSRFCRANDIELLLRGVNGRCLSYDESIKLAALCYRPVDEIEKMGDKKIVSINKSKSGKAPFDLPSAVSPETAMKRLQFISSYINFYREVFLEPNIRSDVTRNRLREEYQTATNILNNRITGTKQNHHHQIQSLPSEKFLQIIKAVFLNPEKLFLTNSGKISSTMLRDRAITLLGCEGLRPGSIGNIARNDFNAISEYLHVRDHRRKRGRLTTGTPLLKLGDSTKVNNASETLIRLMPITTYAIQKYIEVERNQILRKRIINKSNGFLFLNQNGMAIKHRSTITSMFKKLGSSLDKLGLLDVGNDPYFINKKKYDFYAYVLRHSSASYYYQENGEEGIESMKIRYSWTIASKMPNKYANRALSDKSSIQLVEFNQMLLNEVQKGKA